MREPTPTSAASRPAHVAGRPLLSVRNLCKHFPIRKGFTGKTVANVRAVHEVSFDLNAGECFGLVGESGSGKTTVGKCILRALEPTSGEVFFCGNGSARDIVRASSAELKRLRRQIQMVFQDPFSSLNPRMSVFDIVGEPLLVHGMTDRREREERVRRLMRQVGLRPQHMQRYPHAFSGGQRQRIGIARALALNPRLIVADEAVSALDVSVQAQVLNLLQRLQRRLNLAFLFIAHDLTVVRHIADRIGVMYAGQIVEQADVDPLFERPLHPYTEALLSAVPMPDPKVRMKPVHRAGEVADPANIPPGCPFHPRCPYAESRCRTERPELREVEPGRRTRCHFAEQLDLKGLPAAGGEA